MQQGSWSDKVWLWTQDLTLGVESKNLASKFTGPFEIQALIRLTFRISKATSVQESPLVPAGPTPPPLCLITGCPVYTLWW